MTSKRLAHIVWRAALVLGFGFTTLALPAAAGDLPNPRQMGPYPVGVTSMTFVDHSRTDPATKGPRTLLTDIWYPATDASRSLPKNQYIDFLMDGTVPGAYKVANTLISSEFAPGFTVKKYNKTFKNVAVRDARIRDGKFPLIVFSHGNGGMRDAYTFWYDYMASHGYIVMAPDHTGNSLFTLVDDKVVIFQDKLRQYSADNRPLDVSFLIDEMTQWDQGGESRFNGHVDLDHIGVAGMSFGGYTALKVIDMDKRVKAALAMAPVWKTRTNYTTPVMMMIGSEDRTIKLDGDQHDRLYYEQSKGPHYLVELHDAGHYTFTNMYQINPDFGDGVGKGKRMTKPGEAVNYLPMKEAYGIINSYSVAFFGRYLKDQKGYDAYLSKNHYGNEITYKTGGTGSKAD